MICECSDFAKSSELFPEPLALTFYNRQPAFCNEAMTCKPLKIHLNHLS